MSSISEDGWGWLVCVCVGILAFGAGHGMAQLSIEKALDEHGATRIFDTNWYCESEWIH